MTWPEAILGAIGFVCVAAIFIAMFYFASKSSPSDPLDRPWPNRQDPQYLWKTTYLPVDDKAKGGGSGEEARKDPASKA